MANYSAIDLIGHLGADPKVKYLDDGKVVTSWRMAINDPLRKDDPASWYNVSIWGKQAEACGKYLHTGSLVHVHGTPKQRPYKDRDGNDRVSFDVKAHSVAFLSSKDDNRRPSNNEPPPYDGDAPF